MKRIALLILIAVVAISSAEAQKVKRVRQVEKYANIWYLLKQGKSRGAELENGKIAVPLDSGYTSIKYLNEDYFIVRQKEDKRNKLSRIYRASTQRVEYIFSENDSGWEVRDSRGIVLIPSSRHYDTICLLFIRNKHIRIDYCFSFCVGKGKPSNRYGVCDLKGNVIIPIDGDTALKDVMLFEGGYYRIKGDKYCALYDSTGKSIISFENKYHSIGQYNFNKWNDYWNSEYIFWSVSIYDKNDSIVVGMLNNKLDFIIPFERGYCYIQKDLCGFDRFFVVKKRDSYGVCDLDGKEVIAPQKVKWNAYWRDRKLGGVLYTQKYSPYKYRTYYGVRIDSLGHSHPDPEHPAGSIYIEEELAESTYQQKEQRNYTPQNQYNNYQATPTYNNNSQQPSQHHNNNTPVREKCKYCMGSGRCQGLNSPGGTLTIKMHCNGSGRCSTCGGKGLMSDGFGSQIKCSDCSYTGKCRFCKGTGKCDRCGGTGYR